MGRIRHRTGCFSRFAAPNYAAGPGFGGSPGDLLLAPRTTALVWNTWRNGAPSLRWIAGAAGIADWRASLDAGKKDTEIKVIRRYERKGRLLGNDLFSDRLENRVGRVQRRLKPGPKPLGRIE
jgi:hypothetical protein